MGLPTPFEWGIKLANLRLYGQAGSFALKPQVV